MFKKNIKGVIFDFDGTLVLSNAIKTEAFIEVAKPFKNGAAEMKNLISKSDGDRYEVLREFCNLMNLGDDYPTLTQKYNNLTEKKIVSAKQVCGAEEALYTVKYDLNLVCCLNTATPITEIEKILDLKGWGHYFDLVLGSGKGKLANNSCASKSFQIPPSNWLVIGDSDDDYKGAKEFGASFIAVEPLERRISEEVEFKIKDYISFKHKILSRVN